MLSYLLHLLDAFPEWRRIRRVALFLVAITAAIFGYVAMRAVQLDPAFYIPFPHALKPLAFYELGKFQRSAQLYRDAYKRASQNGAVAQDPLLRMLLAEDWDGAKAAASVLLRSNPDDVRALKALAEIALREHDTKHGAEIVNHILALNEDDADGLMLAAITATRDRSHTDAIRLLNLALRTGEAGSLLTFLDVLEMTGDLRDLDDPPLCLLAHYYRYLRIYDTTKGRWAVRAAEQAIAAGDHPAEAYVTIGIALEKRGLGQRALEAFLKAVEIDPSHGMAYHWAAAVYSKAGDRSHEHLMRQAAFDTNPTDTLFREELYYELNNRKDFYLLAKAMQTTITANNSDIVAHSHAAYAYRQLGDEQQGHQHLEQALLLEPKGPAAYDTKAWVFQEMGQWDEMEQVLKKSIQLDGERPRPHRTLARLYQQQGRIEEAFVEFAQAVALGGREETQSAMEFCSMYDQKDRARAEACRERPFGKHR